ncbi:MAG: diaminobutyrate acetyltransferase [Zetaproteobacteria bacterium CG_4_9_14_3_um_filter_49_83]|nr:MAG: diaminobutyrate acetyltransferase [Zetaproteobacteria bacterium CG1_02_49_23]PIQ33421.1 MAG: diaminobutyrate acetyltransferase [Zetaproteobacteria bacterium CG17_big_fil_post_rev_8_21_14_2_50_50_13]PIY55628.1 MAG: diaminobutyrate acetyltransferase [Zetaproteobacteria bacterium CG_4_10_14_0_8_um_filter_49_80]PJA35977.1 MAG: diaminobutyrate acetyltransferase [Zetaproteobacteria bacterium CG_4_9_14_3_um_filter_49_83]
MLSDLLKQDPSLAIRKPTVEDGPSIYDLVKSSKPLDVNSRYLYLLQCSHFAKTCAVAESDGSVQAFISAYVLPDQPETLFVWQLAVDKLLRGQGIAGKLISHLLQRPHLAKTRFIEATVNPSNNASRNLFKSLALKHNCEINESMLFEAKLFDVDAHEAEILLRVGPIQS